MVFNRKTGLLAAVLAAVYGPLIYFDGELLSVTLTIFLNLILLIVLLRSNARPAGWKWIGGGMLFGISLQTNASIILFLPLMLLWAAGTLKQPEWKKTILILLGVSLTVLPFSLRNYFKGGDFVLLSSTAGINLFIGNNPDADGKSAFAPSRDFSYSDWEDNILISSFRLVRRQTGADISPSEVSGYWTGQALRFITTDPVGFIHLLTRKFYFFFNGFEIPENNSIYFYRLWSPLLKLLVFSIPMLSFPFGIICPLALLGLGVTLRRDKRVNLLGLFLAAHLFLLLIFFVCSRYRMPAIPVFLVFAAVGVFFILDSLWQKRFLSCVLLLPSLLIVFFFSNSSIYRVKEDPPARWFLSLGNAYRLKGATRQAITAYRQALREAPDNPDIVYNLAVVLLEEGRLEKAEELFLRVIRLDPEDSAAYSNLGVVYSRKNDYSRAMENFRQAVILDPEDFVSLVNMAGLQIRRGDMDSARQMLDKAQARSPAYAPIFLARGNLYQKDQAMEKAELEYRKAISLNPDYLEAWLSLSELYSNQGYKEQADYARAMALDILAGRKTGLRKKPLRIPYHP